MSRYGKCPHCGGFIQIVKAGGRATGYTRAEIKRRENIEKFCTPEYHTRYVQESGRAYCNYCKRKIVV